MTNQYAVKIGNYSVGSLFIVKAQTEDEAVRKARACAALTWAAPLPAKGSEKVELCRY